MSEILKVKKLDFGEYQVKFKIANNVLEDTFTIEGLSNWLKSAEHKNVSKSSFELMESILTAIKKTQEIKKNGGKINQQRGSKADRS